jgi:hypothetical protein
VALIVALPGCGSGGTTGSSGASSVASTPSSDANATQAVPLCSNGATFCVSQSPRATVRGPADIAANLRALIAKSERGLAEVAITCSAPRAYPVHCRLKAIESSKGRREPVSGTVTVLGVETHTDTYAFQLVYSPVKG